MTAFNWVCNTHWALGQANLGPEYGPIYATQFSVRNCESGESGKPEKTCHCAESRFMLGQQKDLGGTIATNMANTWGEFFRTGTFPDNTLVPFNEMNKWEVNLIDETSTSLHQRREMTFGKECAVLDNSLPSGYDDTKWEKPIQKLAPKWYQSEAEENEKAMAATTIVPTTMVEFERVLQQDAVIIEVVLNFLK